MKTPISLRLSETALISAMIRGGGAVCASVCSRLAAADFQYDDTEIAFRCVSRLAESGIALSPSALRESLAQSVTADPRGESLSRPYSGGAAQWAQVFVESRFAEPTDCVANADWHAGRVADHALLRKTRSALAANLALADERLAGETPELGAEEVVGRAQTDILALSPASRSETSVPELLPGFWDRMQAEYALPPGTLRGLDTGFPTLNEITQGFQAGQFIVLSAGSGVGKSALALNLVLNACRAHFDKTGTPLGAQIFSFEMGKDELLERMVFAEARVSINRFHTRTLSASDHSRMSEAARRIARIGAGIDIHDDASYTTGRIASLCRQAAFRGRCGLILVDYAQIVPAEAKPGSRQENREREVAGIADALLSLARDARINAPVLALSQLNDDGKLRESRVLEKNAHLILNLERTQDKDAASEDEGVSHALRVVKGRSARKGRVWLSFYGGQTRFEETEMGEF